MRRNSDSKYRLDVLEMIVRGPLMARVTHEEEGKHQSFRYVICRHKATPSIHMPEYEVLATGECPRQVLAEQEAIDRMELMLGLPRLRKAA